MKVESWTELYSQPFCIMPVSLDSSILVTYFYGPEPKIAECTSSLQNTPLLAIYTPTACFITKIFLEIIFIGPLYILYVRKGCVKIPEPPPLKNLKLPLHLVFTLSCDRPNVNRSIKQQVGEVIQNEGSKGLAEVGFCTIHVVHSSFCLFASY